MEEFIDMQDYRYNLSPDRIASHPLTERDQSKLLVYRAGKIIHSHFDQLPQFLPPHSLLFFNDTKVISARLIFHKETGAEIEIFLLGPVWPSSLILEAMQTTSPVQWMCSVGNLKRWTNGISLLKEKDNISLVAKIIDRHQGVVEFSWSPVHFSFAEIISVMGVTPLPPYLNRKAEPEDRDRYQTIYSSAEGAVAAPTAGLHFTKKVLDRLQQKAIPTDFLTLHVSAGTFLPVKEQNALAHNMHAEQLIVSEQNIANLLAPDKRIVAVGTTSLRSLESLYWFGAKLLHHPDAEFKILKFDPYDLQTNLPSREESFRAVAEMMKRREIQVLRGETSIYILPGYTFRACDGLITNFHQPGSTLLLLIAAFIGEDWRRVYNEALGNQYRFLSYGDSSLLMPAQI